ncbi:uncharacterized protein C15orf39 homolog isoform X2 [Hypomesus transpacificus]|nr:uncharacterized protein C15orf39 homolog isoform X2 [Hypomesus transpacificus]
MTMNNKLSQSLINPVPLKKMAGLEGTFGSLATAGLSAEGLHRFPNSQLPQYSGTYFTCEPRLPDGANLPPFWGPPDRALLNGRNAMIHSPGEKGPLQNQVVYTADNLQFPTEGNHASPAQDLPAKQGFSYYTKSPERRSVMAPEGGTTGSVRKHAVGSGNVSPTSGNSICLAFPKPIYGHSPCCSELGCTARPRYRVEPGEQSVDPNVYEEDWVLYSHRALLHGSNPAFMQPRSIQPERSVDRLPLKDEFLSLSPNEKRTLPPFTESNYVSYPCTPTRPLVAPSNEPCQRLQIPSKAFHGLYPSHAPTYKHMSTSVHLASSSQLYQHPAPMSTYGQLTQQQMFYYPQANVEAESGVAYKDVGGKYRADVDPSVHRNSPPNPLAHYIVSQPRFCDVPLVSHMVPPNSHAFLRGYDHGSTPVYRMNLTADQMRSTIDELCVPPQVMQMGRFCAPTHNLHMDRPTSHSHSIQGDHPRVPQPNLHMNRPCAPPHSQPFATSYRLLMDKAKAPPQSQHMDRSGASAPSPQPEQALDYSKYRGTSPRQAQDHPEAGRDSLARRSSDGRGHPHHTSAVNYNTDPQRITGSPAVCSKGNHVPRSNADFKSLKRSPSDMPLNNQPTSLDYSEVAVEMGPSKKRMKTESEQDRASSCQLLTSNPMPVINNVFSLAPYKAYLEAAGMLPSLRSSPKVEEPEHGVVKAEPHAQENDHQQEGEKPVVSFTSTEVKPVVLPDSSKEEPVVKMIELTKIKKELLDSDHILEQVKQDGPMDIPVKNEESEKDSSVSGLMLVIKKCDPDELESKSFKSANNVSSLECVDDPLLAQEKVRPSIPTSLQWTVRPKQATAPELSDGKPDLQKIPPQCLKLSTYNIVLPERLQAAPPVPKSPEEFQPPAQTYVVQGTGDLRPTRQHFMELHQALCRLLSKSVTQSSKPELRAWLSKLEPTGPSTPSTKAQNLCGLMGAEARELWLSNVEIRCSLQKVLHRLKEYITQHHCPFPHVKRTGAVFIPMLVLKEILFPQVQGTFINQVLQEHKVELRPTTLSEEKTLTQLHKRACPSKLRRLLSLKNLPEIYVDVLNLLYHSCVCKHMESTSLDDVQKTVQVFSAPFFEV